jgi:hypothetical protein
MCAQIVRHGMLIECSKALASLDMEPKVDAAFHRSLIVEHFLMLFINERRRDTVASMLSIVNNNCLRLNHVDAKKALCEINDILKVQLKIV